MWVQSGQRLWCRKHLGPQHFGGVPWANCGFALNPLQPACPLVRCACCITQCRLRPSVRRGRRTCSVRNTTCTQILGMVQPVTWMADLKRGVQLTRSCQALCLRREGSKGTVKGTTTVREHLPRHHLATFSLLLVLHTSTFVFL
jgi:hypothetical protein